MVRVRKAGELASSSDRQRGASVYRYLKNGDLLSRSTREHLNNEHFETDPAGNRLDPQRGTRFGHIKDNRLRHWQQYRYRYDAWGNVIERRGAAQLNANYSNTTTRTACVPTGPLPAGCEPLLTPPRDFHHTMPHPSPRLDWARLVLLRPRDSVEQL